MDKNTRIDLALQLASMLYEQQSKRKRRRAFSYFKSNNWDVTGLWEDCLKQAAAMIDSGIVVLQNHLANDKTGANNE